MDLTHAQRNLQSTLKTGKLLCGDSVVSLELLLQTAWKGAVLGAVFLLKEQLSQAGTLPFPAPAAASINITAGTRSQILFLPLQGMRQDRATAEHVIFQMLQTLEQSQCKGNRFHSIIPHYHMLCYVQTIMQYKLS